MQLPSVDRSPNLYPSGAEAGSTGANRVIPVAPVNPSVQSSPSLESAGQGVVNKINPAVLAASQHTEGEPVYTSVADPVQRGSSASSGATDWTTRKPAAEKKVEDPPPKPLHQLLIEQIKNLWQASAGAIQVEQIKDQSTTPTQVTPNQVPGELAKQVLTYQPTKIKKTGEI